MLSSSLPLVGWLRQRCEGLTAGMNWDAPLRSVPVMPAVRFLQEMLSYINWGF
jgi:hypothetical protein